MATKKTKKLSMGKKLAPTKTLMRKAGGDPQ
jgi:hypothetical protein